MSTTKKTTTTTTTTMFVAVGRVLTALSVVCILSGRGRGVSASLETDSASHSAAVAAAAAAGGYKGRSAGRCERITIPLCLDMKYNMTRMPNLVGHSTQAEAAMQVLVLQRASSFHLIQPTVSAVRRLAPPAVCNGPQDGDSSLVQNVICPKRIGIRLGFVVRFSVKFRNLHNSISDK